MTVLVPMSDVVGSAVDDCINVHHVDFICFWLMMHSRLHWNNILGVGLLFFWCVFFWGGCVCVCVSVCVCVCVCVCIVYVCVYIVYVCVLCVCVRVRSMSDVAIPTTRTAIS